MTLDTRIHIRDKISPHDVFDKCRELIGATDKHTFTDEKSRYRDGNWIISNNPGQGLSAWLMVFYRKNAPVEKGIWATVSFDTGYAYSDEHGYGCGDLHAEYIARLGLWLDSKNIRWSWVNEFTGETHHGYNKLLDLQTGGFEASAWFRTTVLPLIKKGR